MSRQKNSLLWKISGNSLKKPSYLFGTMHLMCASDFLIREKVLKAFSKCTALYMEMDLAHPPERSFGDEELPVTNSISAGLTDAEKDELDAILRKEYNLTLAQADVQPSIMVINRMVTKAIDCEEVKIFEMEFVSMAQNASMKTGGLETQDEQLHIAETVYDSKNVLRQLRAGSDYAGMFRDMSAAYHSENLQILFELITNRKFMSEEEENLMVIDRNKKWAKMIPALIREQPVFFAVGAGHLPGPDGLIESLKKSGFHVNPVYR